MALIAGRDTLPFSDSIEDYPEGIILPIDKPWRWTSADVVRKIKFAATRHFHKKNLKVGHAGTLDPLATGVLLVCLGKATKEAESLQKHDKEYIAEVVFGATTPSYDLEKEPDRYWPMEGVSREALLEVLPRFLGEQEQVAPLFSAKSVDGIRAYEMARRLYRTGGDIDAAALDLLTRQKITISALELLDYSSASFDGCTSAVGTDPLNSGASAADPACDDAPAAEIPSLPSSRINFASTDLSALPRARIRISCSKGTYIRALARDLGEELGSGAHLGSLIRTRTGTFRLDDALTLDAALKLLHTDRALI